MFTKPISWDKCDNSITQLDKRNKNSRVGYACWAENDPRLKMIKTKPKKRSKALLKRLYKNNG